MNPAVQPAYVTVAIEERRARQLRRVFHSRRAPVLAKAGGPVLPTAFAQRTVGKEPQQVVVPEPHGRIRALFGVRDAARGIAEARAKFARQFRRANHDEAHGNTGSIELAFDLAQLRERFTEKRSTDVPKPNDQGGKRKCKLRNGCGHGLIHHQNLVYTT